MKTLALSIVLAALLAGCTDGSTARHALDSAGYTDIRTYGYDWFACGQDDFFATRFSAKNPAGKTVSGVVCSGLFFKSATIRF